MEPCDLTNTRELQRILKPYSSSSNDGEVADSYFLSIQRAFPEKNYSITALRCEAAKGIEAEHFAEYTRQWKNIKLKATSLDNHPLCFMNQCHTLSDLKEKIRTSDFPADFIIDSYLPQLLQFHTILVDEKFNILCSKDIKFRDGKDSFIILRVRAPTGTRTKYHFAMELYVQRTSCHFKRTLCITCTMSKSFTMGRSSKCRSVYSK